LGNFTNDGVTVARTGIIQVNNEICAVTQADIDNTHHLSPAAVTSTSVA
jgi:hypothetical protein